MTEIVVVIGALPSSAGLSGLAGEASGLERLLRETTKPRVTVVALGIDRKIEGLAALIEVGNQPAPIVDRIFRALGFYALRHRLSTFPIGRLLNSMGPIDQGRVFWRQVRQSPAAVSALRRTDIVVAADLPAIKTCWTAQKRGWSTRAQYDYRAAGLGTAFSIPPKAADPGQSQAS